MPAFMRSLWREPAPPDAPPAGRRDGVLAGVFTVVVVLEPLLRADPPWRWTSALIAAGLTLTLIWRRQRPLLMLIAALATSTLVAAVTRGEALQQVGLLGVLLLPYALGRWGSGRDLVLGAGAMTLAVLAPAAMGNPVTLGDTVGGLAVVFAAAALGAAVRYRARMRARELEQVGLRERERLARDLHDIVAHHVSAMAVTAQAGLAATDASGPAADALRLVEAEARRTLDEMRGMVRVLRRSPGGRSGPDGGAELPSSPRLSDLSDLAGTPAIGPAVEVRLSGAVDRVDPSVAATVYRLAQESITNARRHARRAGVVRVAVRAEESVVRLAVTDDGEPVVRSGPDPDGHGIVGMVERAQLLGGTCEAGPRPGGGWAVTAVLPARPGQIGSAG